MSIRNVMITVAMFSFATGSLAANDGQAEAPALVPCPAEMQTAHGALPITAATAIYVELGNPEVQAVGRYLADCLRQTTGHTPAVREVANDAGSLPRGAILLVTTPGALPRAMERYELRIGPTHAILAASQPRGLFLGVQTIRQLLVRPPPAAEDAKPTWQIPCVTIKDEPRYAWRGMLLDCGRHFMSKDFVKRYIDLLAYHKMNVLHWHLTEDQGWRIEIKRYPKLTKIGAWRGEGDERYGGFYTQEDIREIVAYAQSRYVTIVPEIEMPGHSLAALASYPELGCVGEAYQVGTRWGVYDDVYCAGNDQTFEFLQNVLSEVIELFPAAYIHIGGDECPKTRWESCPKCQARIKAEGLKNEHELQSYFIRRIEKFLNGKGRRIIGWDEILEGGLAPNATVQSWRGMKGAIAAATAGHDVISSPTSHCYLDYAQVRRPGEPTFMGYIDLKSCYSFEPTPNVLTQLQARHVLGLEGNMWTEHAPQERVDWQVFPRLCALAEVGWSPKRARDWGDFSQRMKTHYRRLDALGVTYFLEPPRCTNDDLVFTESITVTLDNPLGAGAMHYTLDDSEPTPESPRYKEPINLTETTLLKARTFLPNSRASGVAEFHFRKLSPLEPGQTPDTAPSTRPAPRLPEDLLTGLDGEDAFEPA